MKGNFYQQPGRLFVLLRDVGIRLQFWETLERLCSLVVKRSTVTLSIYAFCLCFRLGAGAFRLGVAAFRLALRFVDMSTVVDYVDEERCRLFGTFSRNAVVRRQAVGHIDEECHRMSTRSYSTSISGVGCCRRPPQVVSAKTQKS